MIKRLLCNFSWNSILNANPPDEHFYFIVDNFFKHDKINPLKFENNLQFLQYQYASQPYLLSPAIFYFRDAVNRPFGYEDWFMAAYPDVGRWTSENADLLENISPFKEQLELEEEDGFRMSYTFLRLLIDYYKRNVRRRLECAY